MPSRRDPTVINEVRSASFGEALRRYRLEAGWTQEELAERAAISADAIAALETGRRRSPRRDTVQQLADALALKGSEREALFELARRAPPSEPASATPPAVRTFLIADIRSYTRFTVEHGDEAAVRLVEIFTRLVRQAIETHEGEVLELRGDEALCVFSSARSAVRAAVNLQVRCAQESIAEPDFPLPIGIGLDAGEAVPFEGGYRGSALNLAARLCSIAGPGQVLATKAVVHLASKLEGLSYGERGLADLKGFAEPVRVIEVSPETDGLDEESSANLQWRSAGQATAAQRSLPIGNFLGALPSGPLVAREDELEQIHRVLDAVSDGSGQLLLCAGEAGIGKTRLMQEVMVQARDRGFLVAAGRCYEAQQTAPCYPFLDALATVYASAPQSIRLNVGRRWPHLARLLPGSMLAPPPTSGDEREDGLPLFQAVTGFLQAVAEEAPVAILLDDLHWADESSLQLLQYLARHSRGDRVLLAGSCLDATAGRHPALEQTLRDLSRERLVERIAVRRLSAEETAALVATTMGQTQASEEFADFVHRRTKGNPLYVDEMLRALGGRLRLVREIGAGGWGRVFEAIDSRTGKRVAAKLLFARGETDLDALVRFQQEGAVLSTLKHPHIVEVYSTFLEEHASCIIMELLEGVSLARIIREGPVPFERIQRLMIQVTEALGYAHGRKIVHRDIKPDNIMVVGEDFVKVTDFGIARILRPDASMSSMASTGKMLGTPLYMAPEQIEGLKVDGRADIYSLGALLYELVTGQPPFEGADPLTIAFKHVNETPRPPRKLNGDVPRDWEALIMKALAKKPADRFATAQQMGTAIAALSKGRATISPPTAEESAAVEPTPDGRPSTPVRERLRELTPARKARTPTPAPSRRATPHPEVAVQLGPLLRITGIPAWIAAAGILVLVFATVYVLHSMSSSPSPVAIAPKPILVIPAAAPHRIAFRAPDGVAVDRHGNVFVADQLLNGVSEISPDGRLLASWQGQGTRLGQFSGPAGVTVDARGDLYVADTGNGRIQELPAGTSRWKMVGSHHFAAPYGVAVGPGGTIYVAAASDGIQKLSPTDGSAGSLAAGTNIQYAAGVAVDARGSVYVADSNAGRVEELSANGRLLKVLGRGLLRSPDGVAVDGHGNIYVSDSQASQVRELSPRDNLLHSWTRGSGSLSFSNPAAVALDGAGNVYVADGNRVQQLSPAGLPLHAWTSAGASEFKQPAAMTMDPQGDAWIVDVGTGYLRKVSPDGTLLVQWGSHGRGSGRFTEPSGVTVDPHGNVYVADGVDNLVYEFSPAGKLLNTNNGSSSLQFSAPTNLAVDTRGTIYIADTGNDHIWELTAQGNLLAPIGQPGAGPGQFSGPVGVAVDRAGTLYVVDQTNDVVQQHTTAGKWTEWGAKGSAPGQFRGPSAAAVDQQGNVYIADTDNNRIQKLSPAGKVLAIWGMKGSARGQFRSPQGVAIDRQGNVYVADTGNARIEKFAPVTQ